MGDVPMYKTLIYIFNYKVISLLSHYSLTSDWKQWQNSII
jgi:hypothetical protein